MRTLRKNKQSMMYALQLGTVPIYQTDNDGNVIYDHYEDSEGNIIDYVDENGNKTPLYTGEEEIVFSTPQPFMANISESGGESTALEYGLSPEDYTAVLVIAKNAVPLVEGALIWANSKPKYKYGGEEVTYDIGGKEVTTTAPEQTSADYMVKKTPKMPLNFAKILLDAIVK